MSPNRYLRDIPLPGMDQGPSGYRGPAVTKVVGITYRQLDYWTTTGLVSASVRDADGSGTQRLYGFSDIVELKVIKRLLDAGVDLRKIRAVVVYLRERGLQLRDTTLASDGSTVYALTDDAGIIDVLKRGQGVFAIAIDPVVTELEADILALDAERADPPVSRKGKGGKQVPGQTAVNLGEVADRSISG